MRKFIISITLLAVVATWLFYKYRYIPHHQYNLVSPKVGDINKTVFGIGQIEATQIYKITPQEGGKIIQLFAKVGDSIKKGEQLASIDPIDLPFKVASSKLEIQKQELLFKANQEDLKAQKAKELWSKREYLRFKRLIETNSSSQEQLEHALSDYNASQAQTKSLILKLQATKKSIEIAKANFKGLNAHLKRTKIFSPIDGVVISQNATLAQTLLANQTIFEAINPNDLRVYALIDERLCSNLKIGQNVRIALRSKPKRFFQGTISRIDPKADSVTLQKQIEIKFNKTPKNWTLNEEAKVWIHTSTLHNALLLPAKALVYRDKEVGVWSLIGKKAHFSPIDIITQQNKIVAIRNISPKSEIIIPTPDSSPIKEGTRVVKKSKK